MSRIEELTNTIKNLEKENKELKSDLSLALQYLAKERKEHSEIMEKTDTKIIEMKVELNCKDNKIDELLNEIERLKNRKEKNNSRGAGRKKSYCYSDIDLIRTLRYEGKTMAEIAKVMHMSVGTIHKIINENYIGLSKES